MSRNINEIAQEIERTWPKVHYAARPYLELMHRLKSIEGYYVEGSARIIVSCFLSNASTWRGKDARRIKAELKSLVSRKPPKRASHG